MAEYYSGFSFEIGELTQAEKDWIDKRFEDSYELEPWDDGYLDFDHEMSDKTLSIYAEEYGEPDKAALFVREFLRKFRPQEEVCFGVAFWCSKPRADAFGGGTMRVTAAEYKFCDGSCLKNG